MKTFGTRLEVNVILERKCEKNHKFWREKAIKPRIGILIGFRTLSNGLRDYDSEYGYEYRASEYFKVALIVFSEKENPVYVPLTSLK